jgi:hypothetical protein
VSLTGEPYNSDVKTMAGDDADQDRRRAVAFGEGIVFRI